MLVAILRPPGVHGNEAVRCPGGEVGTTIRMPGEDLDADGFARAPPGEHRHVPLPSPYGDATVVRVLEAIRHAGLKSCGSADNRG